MNKTRMAFALAAGFLLATVAPLAAQEAKPPTADELRAAYVDEIGNAYELAEFAAKYKSPEAFIAAAGLLLKIEAQTKGKLGDAPKEVEIVGADGKSTVEKVEAAKLSDQAKAWFDDARGLAVDSKLKSEVAALIAAAEKRDYTNAADPDVKERGKTGGPANIRRTIKPNDTQVFKWTFKADEWAAIGMTSGSSLGITIVGPQGARMFSLHGARANYRWMPKEKMEVIIRVHNGTNKPTTFNLASN